MERINDEFKITELGAENAPTENIEWQGNTIETTASPLVDGNYGEAKVIRTFEFTLPPGMPHHERVCDKEMLEYHMKKIRMFLWKDGLEQDGEPRIAYNKKDNSKFSIIIVARPKPGAVLLETPLSLNHL